MLATHDEETAQIYFKDTQSQRASEHAVSSFLVCEIIDSLQESLFSLLRTSRPNQAEDMPVAHGHLCDVTSGRRFDVRMPWLFASQRSCHLEVCEFPILQQPLKVSNTVWRRSGEADKNVLRKEGGLINFTHHQVGQEPLRC